VESRAGLRLAIAALDGYARVCFGHGLARLDSASRHDFLARVARIPQGTLLLDMVKAAVLLVYGADSHAADLLTRSRRTPPARPDGILDVTPSAWWPSTAKADAVVIGSGAGGAMVARRLARSGMTCVVVEEGRRFTVEEFRTRAPIERFVDLYRGGGSTIALGNPPVVLPIGRGVGGTTLVNSGTCYRTPRRVLERWRDEHGLALADPGAFTPYLDEVGRTLQIDVVPSDVMGRNGETVLAGADALGWAAGPLLRNAPGCGGCCQCAIGCPRNAKAGVHLNALPQACAAGARIVSEARVQRIVHENGRVRGVLVRRRDGSMFRILTSCVVVAAGATETPPLLRRSGLGRHPRLGRGLALHPAVGVAGRFDEPIVGWQGVLQSAGVEEFHESDGILIEATATPPGMGSMTLPGYGARLLDELAGADRLATVGAMIADSGAGRVVGARRSLIVYQTTRRDGARLLKAIGLMARVLFAAGATEVLTPFHGQPAIRCLDELDELSARRGYRGLHVAAFHPTGTAAAGADPEVHPVTPDGTLRGVTGVWVADASILPTCPEVNPQWTIMALALAVAETVSRSGRDYRHIRG
jgi:choline dehydrogenase-like flavoprotein